MKIITLDQAADLIHDGDTILIGGSGGGHAVPEALIVAVADRFHRTGSPRNITTLHPVGIGDMDTQGVGRLAHPGLLRRIITGALVNTPAVQKMAQEDAVEAYTLPQGVLSQLMREMAADDRGDLACGSAHLCRSASRRGTAKSLGPGRFGRASGTGRARVAVLQTDSH